MASLRWLGSGRRLMLASIATGVPIAWLFEHNNQRPTDTLFCEPMGVAALEDLGLTTLHPHHERGTNPQLPDNPNNLPKLPHGMIESALRKLPADMRSNLRDLFQSNDFLDEIHECYEDFKSAQSGNVLQDREIFKNAVEQFLEHDGVPLLQMLLSFRNRAGRLDRDTHASNSKFAELYRVRSPEERHAQVQTLVHGYHTYHHDHANYTHDEDCDRYINTDVLPRSVFRGMLKQRIDHWLAVMEGTSQSISIDQTIADIPPAQPIITQQKSTQPRRDQFFNTPFESREEDEAFKSITLDVAGYFSNLSSSVFDDFSSGGMYDNERPKQNQPNIIEQSGPLNSYTRARTAYQIRNLEFDEPTFRQLVESALVDLAADNVFFRDTTHAAKLALKFGALALFILWAIRGPRASNAEMLRYPVATFRNISRNPLAATPGTVGMSQAQASYQNTVPGNVTGSIPRSTPSS